MSTPEKCLSNHNVLDCRVCIDNNILHKQKYSHFNNCLSEIASPSQRRKKIEMKKKMKKENRHLNISTTQNWKRNPPHIRRHFMSNNKCFLSMVLTLHSMEMKISISGFYIPHNFFSVEVFLFIFRKHIFAGYYNTRSVPLSYLYYATEYLCVYNVVG